MKIINKTQHSSGGIILNNDGKIVLVCQNKIRTSWSFPKGRVEDNETLFETAKREIYEETGLEDIVFINDLGNYKRYQLKSDGSDDRSKPKVIHLFLFKTNELKLNPVDQKIFEAKWFTREEVLKKLSSTGDRKYFLQIMNEI